jgi:hypothetical protein
VIFKLLIGELWADNQHQHKVFGVLGVFQKNKESLKLNIWELLQQNEMTTTQRCENKIIRKSGWEVAMRQGKSFT